MFVRKSDGVTTLDRYRFTNENELQELLFRNYDLIFSIPELEQVGAKRAISFREFPVSTGSIDLLLINTDAEIVLVETKLLRNPEASRTVIAQIIDYVKNFVQLDVNRFIEVCAGSKNCQILPELINDSRFVSSLKANMEKGNIQVLIFGDEINPNLLGMVESIQSAPHLAFTIFLVRMPVFKLGELLIMNPEVIAKTTEIERSVIRISIDLVSGKTQIESQVPDKNGMGSKPVITWESYLANVVNAEFRAILSKFKIRWMELDGPGFNMGTVGFSAGIFVGGRRVPIQYCYDGYLDLLSNKFRNNYSIPDEVYTYYTEQMMKLPRIYDSKLVSGKVRLTFEELSSKEFETILNISLETARFLKHGKPNI